MSENANNGTETHLFDAMPFKLALPMVAVGTFIIALSCAFCCYLARIRKDRVKVGGYKKVTLNKGKDNPLQDTKNDTCPVCLEDFKNKEVLAICPCSHVFHKNKGFSNRTCQPCRHGCPLDGENKGCLRKWLIQRPSCPMCMTQVCASSNHNRSHRSHSGNRSAGTTSFTIPTSVGASPSMFPSHV